MLLHCWRCLQQVGDADDLLCVGLGQEHDGDLCWALDTPGGGFTLSFVDCLKRRI